jgi:hypothetical protein
MDGGQQGVVELEQRLAAGEHHVAPAARPKAGAPLRLTGGHELKLVYPQAGLDPDALAELDFRPMGPAGEPVRARAAATGSRSACGSAG